MEHTFIQIAAGKVTLETGGYLEEATTFDVPALFEIGKYPITNGQYRLFIEDGGYNQKQWWTKVSWEWKESEGWEAPRTTRDGKWGSDNHPVVGVSWYEAMAFCQWMSEKTGQNITLPTEQQWQRAAQAMPDGSDTGFAYVWGNEWDSMKCNNSAGEPVLLTTEVTKYESAGNVSPCGVVDLIGNVWEWCLTEYETGGQNMEGANIRVVKGGAWYNRCTYFFQVSSRSWYYPYLGNEFIGFRVVRLTD